MDHKTMQWLAALIPDVSVVRFNFHYRAQGKSIPDRMPTLMETYRSVIKSVRRTMLPKRLVIGGHSMGGRVASMIESESKAADGLLLLGYPLHPPGQFEKTRDAHLGQIRTRTLQINGTSDELCQFDLMNKVHSTLNPELWQLHWIEGADHSYSVKKSTGRSREDVAVEITDTVRAWLS